MFILFLFTIPFAAVSLAELGATMEAATRGEVSGGIAIWATAFFLFLFSVIGG